MKRIILLGKGTLAIKISNWFLKSDEYEIVGVVPVIPEPSWTDSFMMWAKENKLHVISSGHYKDIPNVLDPHYAVDLAFSIFYDKIIKEWFIKKCKQILNLHNGPLPKYRGVSPINWALKNNEKSHGITIHQITPGIDDGPIISQVVFSIYPEFDEVKDVYLRSLEYGWTLFKETIYLIDKITPTLQDNSQAIYYNAKQNDLLLERRNFTKQESINSFVLENENMLQEYADRLIKYKEI